MIACHQTNSRPQQQSREGQRCYVPRFSCVLFAEGYSCIRVMLYSTFFWHRSANGIRARTPWQCTCRPPSPPPHGPIWKAQYIPSLPYRLTWRWKPIVADSFLPQYLLLVKPALFLRSIYILKTQGICCRNPEEAFTGGSVVYYRCGLCSAMVAWLCYRIVCVAVSCSNGRALPGRLWLSPPSTTPGPLPSVLLLPAALECVR